VLLVACGGGQKPASEATAPEKKEADAGATSADAGAPAEKPFAGSASEATQLISSVIDKKSDAIGKCVKEYRYRKHLAHERVDVSVGIDQDGHVLGATLPKGKKDDELSACVLAALKDAPFPRSHAGVITVTRSFEEVVQ
jgi:outer membrane biosynthesis protein TonB